MYQLLDNANNIIESSLETNNLTRHEIQIMQNWSFN